jgi:hypothetical protein
VRQIRHQHSVPPSGGHTNNNDNNINTPVFHYPKTIDREYIRKNAASDITSSHSKEKVIIYLPSCLHV